MQLILKTNKKIGETPKEVLDLMEKNTKSLFFHTGTLDVMAEGLLVLVNSKLRFLEKWFKSLKKEYEFELILGLSTDTHDLLGLITNTSKTVQPREDIIVESLKKICKIKSQVPPKVSYKNLNSQKKLKAFLQGSALKSLPAKKVKVYKLEQLYESSISRESLIDKVLSSLEVIKKDYRQKEISESYRQSLSKLPKKLMVTKFKIRVSSGFYIRALARDLTEEIKFPVCVYSIKRTKVGPFSL